MRELKYLVIAAALSYLVVGNTLLHAVGEPGSGLDWDEPPTTFRKAVVVLFWPVVLVHMRTWR